MKPKFEVVLSSAAFVAVGVSCAGTSSDGVNTIGCTSDCSPTALVRCVESCKVAVAYFDCATRLTSVSIAANEPILLATHDSDTAHRTLTTKGTAAFYTF